MKFSRRLRLIVLVLLFLWLVAGSARFLIIDEPEKSDVILVLAGETEQRPARALQLLNEGYAPRVVFDVPADARMYGSTYLEIAQKWAAAQPQASAIVICPIQGLSTKAETADAAECLRKIGVRSVLVVTSDFHTRRALSIFRRENPEFTFSVAAAYDATQFGEQWWRHRQWAKTNVDEWLRMFWWQLVDRWER
ncbi:MAG TPA: YdcF family protein [Terriglobales bacterium]|nr:YdcF family protein [Terriglobales bacterium]